MSTKKKTENKTPTLEEIGTMYKEGMSTQDIADNFGISIGKLSGIRWLLGLSGAIKRSPYEFGRKISSGTQLTVNVGMFNRELGIDGDKLSNYTWRVSKVGVKKFEVELKEA